MAFNSWRFLHNIYFKTLFRQHIQTTNKDAESLFYDTGLLCYLLGIETEEEYDSSILRGTIFENMAISELIKNQYKQARIPDLLPGTSIKTVIYDGPTSAPLLVNIRDI